MHSKKVHMVAFLLLIVGGLNWGLVGVTGDFDLVAWIFSDLMGVDILTRIVYVLVGLAAISEALSHKKSCRHCSVSGGAAPSVGGAGDMTHG